MTYRDVHIAHRANELLNLRRYSNADQTVDSLPLPAWRLDLPEEQHVLRMLVFTLDTGWLIPDELKWLTPAINLACLNQNSLRKERPHPFVYLTVRSGVMQSVTDDEWHVDGFSMRMPHEPEQNYVWADSHQTEHLAQQFDIPADFDPLKHNLHWYFQDRADSSKIQQLACEHLHLIDPYIVHRHPQESAGTRRTFFRISFGPIEIENDSCTPNPLMSPRHYGRTDIRKTLKRYGE